ncbi:MAG: imidazolonepropionase [Alphaproteobacteria bacterium]|nr:imidazolonepropionase [Alphaproteobacteria bacterium]MDE2629677.1 imidazolonepropionase [Alphaproteobacteria bacterium]
MWDILLLECRAATMVSPGPASYGAVGDAAIGIAGGQLVYVGPRRSLPDKPEKCARAVRRLGGAWVTPGLIDCHTHLVFAGNRAAEWEMRARGASYEDIARGGGGILSTVRATRAASEDVLVESATQRARAMARRGVTTIEIKSGYGLESESEKKMLRAAARAGERAHVRVVRTFLGAHTLPPEFKDNRESYVESVCEQMIPAIARERLADAVDGFCDKIAFTPAETERVLAAAKTHGLRVKLHAEQLSDSGGAALAAKFGALSADHLEYLSDVGVAAMAKAGTVAVLLPAAYYFLRETKMPPVEALRRAGVPIAVATDCNPGTSPLASPLIALNMACTLFGLTPAEALAGMTLNAARALGLEREIGTLESGKCADLAVWNISDPAELSYWLGLDLLRDRCAGGRFDKDGRTS